MNRVRANADVFRAIADPTRRAILDRLRAGSANAGALAADFRQTRPAISKHVKVLREARLVLETRRGRERYYELNPDPLQAVVGWVEGYRSFWQSIVSPCSRLRDDLEAKWTSSTWIYSTVSIESRNFWH